MEAEQATDSERAHTQVLRATNAKLMQQIDGTALRKHEKLNYWLIGLLMIDYRGCEL